MSKALAVTGPAPVKKQTRAEKLPAVETLDIPAALLLAAETTSHRDAATRPEIASIFIHRHEDMGRVVATDGTRMFISSFDLPAENIPAWLAKGVVLANDGMRTRLSLISKMSSESAEVRIAYAQGRAYAEMSDLNSTAVFRVQVVNEEYPRYDGILGSESFSKLNEDGLPATREWEPIGINSQYLKHCGDIARVLDAGLPKEMRSKAGMVVRAFSGSPDAPMVFDFSTWPGALLIMMPAKLASVNTSKETAALLAPAVRASIAALRAHSTRWIQRAEASSSESEKQAALAKSTDFLERIAELTKRLPGVLEISSEAEPEATAEPAPEPVEDKPTEQPEPEPEPEPEPQAGDPAITRTRVNVNRKAA